MATETSLGGPSIARDRHPTERSSGSGETRPKPRVAVSQDGLQAYITFDQQPDGYSQEEIQQALAQAGITFGVDQDILLSLCGKPIWCQDQLIAQGTPLKHGIHGSIEYLFATDERRTLKERGGRVDWHELGLVASVERGTPLARMHHAQPGTPGQTVQGRLLPCKEGKDTQWKLGDGVVVSEDNPDTATSTVSGSPYIDSGGRLCVRNIHVVTGDVDFSTGNLDFLGSILVQGGVLPGFKLKASGDIEVRGTVENSDLISGGSIVIGSIVGAGKVGICAANDIRANFAENANLRSGGDVWLTREAMHCVIEAEGEVVVGGRTPTQGGIIGGTVSAGKCITAFRIGGMSGSKTSLRVGNDWVATRHMYALEREMAEKDAKLQQIKAGLDRMTTVPDAQMPTKKTVAKQLEDAASSLVQCLKTLTDAHAVWEETSNRPTIIKVYGPLRAGTELTIDGHTRSFMEDRGTEIFLCEGNSVLGQTLRPSDHDAPR